MIKYKQILEAVNRGIRFALDNFDDNGFQGQVNSKVKYKGGMKEYLDLMLEVVDLRLPSGTLWCKYNLDVDPNLLSNAEDWYGKYYAWGELKANKIEFSWSTYKYSLHSYKELRKYCPSKHSEYGHNNFADDLTLLLPEDDATYLNMHLYDFKFHIPTKELCEELLKYTTNKPVENYKNISGLNGIEFTSKINELVLFIPFSGYYDNTGIHMVNKQGLIWTSDICLYPPCCAWRLFLSAAYYNKTNVNDQGGRENGCSIRPVINL